MKRSRNPTSSACAMLDRVLILNLDQLGFSMPAPTPNLLLHQEEAQSKNQGCLRYPKSGSTRKVRPRLPHNKERK